MTLRCTKKLLKRVPSSSTSSGVRPTNALGDDLMFQCRDRLAPSGVTDLESITLELAEVPCRPLGYKHPGQVAVELLRADITRACLGPSQNPKSRLESGGA